MSENNIIDTLLSQLGKRLYFPKGIVAQTEQSADAKIKATAGVAFEGTTLATLPEAKQVHSKQLGPIEQSFSYAPVAGLPPLRAAWKTHLKKRNPSLNLSAISSPIATAGLTHGVSTILHLFLDKEDALITPNYFWENYRHITSTIIGAGVETFPLFDNQDMFNIEALEEILQQHLQTNKKAVMLLNFPNNPTGYSIRKDEEESLSQLLLQYAELGLPILTLLDDAYFGLFYEDDIYPESLFARLSHLHNNILAIKIDGATKELLAWGLRVGFITFGHKGIDAQDIALLEEKIMGFIRGTITSASRLSQNVVLKMLQEETLTNSLEQHRCDLKEKYLETKKAIEIANKTYPHMLQTAPCNAGYFISFLFQNNQQSEQMRQVILKNENIALISIENILRFTFSCVEKKDISTIIHIIYKYAAKMQQETKQN